MERNIKQHIIKSGGIYLLLLLFSACGQEEMLPDYLQGGGEATFSLRPVVQPMRGTVGTRAGESAPTIHEYTVLVYQKIGDGTPDKNKLVRKMQQSGGDKLSFTAEQVKGEHHIYVVANFNDSLAAHVPNTEQDLQNLPVYAGRTQEGSVAAGIMVSSRITLPNFSVEDFNQATAKTGEIPLKQIVAKLTIHFSVKPNVFTPLKVTYISMSGGNTYLFGRKNTDTSNYLQNITRSIISSGTGTGWEDPMYLYEQASTRNGEQGEWQNPGFFLVIEGTYKDSSQPQYFKFALPGIKAPFGDIERNTSYALDITSINKNGYETFEQASDPTKLFSNVTASINPNMAGMDNYKELYTDGYYMMGLNSTEFHFRQALTKNNNYLLTEVRCRALDHSADGDGLSLQNASRELSLVNSNETPELHYLVFKPTITVTGDYTGEYQATLSYGTLRKDITLSVQLALPSSSSDAMKFKAPNGSVSKFSYSTESAGGISYNKPVPETGWAWSSSEWCGLGPNSQFNPSYYFGDVSTSLNENIFVHLRPITAPSTYDGSLRQVYLTAEDHIIDVRVGRTN